MENTEIKEKIAEIRQRYSRLKAICGPQGISRETMADYTKEILKLQAQLA
jgi:hypothetical protein